MALNFVSGGAAAQNAITEFLLRRAMEARQAQQDALAKQQQADEVRLREGDLSLRRAQEARQATMQKATLDDLAHQREFNRATTIAENAMPGDAADEQTAGLMTRQGYSGMLKQVPGLLMQGPLASGDQMDPAEREAELGRAPGQTVMRGGSRYLNAEAQREAQAAAAADARAFRESNANAERELKLLIAGMGQNNSNESRQLRNDLLRIQTQLAQGKLDEQAKARADAAGAVKSTRQTIRDLASGLASDPSLAGITGAIEGRRETFLDGKATDAVSRFNQLAGALAMGERSKLKGQGHISDYEVKLLQKAVTSLNRASGLEITKKTLEQIAAAFAGDAPQGDPASAEDALLNELLGGR